MGQRVLEIGKRYLVDCIQAITGKGMWCGGAIPVFLPYHEDADVLNFPYYHYHVDWRFVGRGLFSRMVAWYEMTSVYDNTITGIPVTADQASGGPFKKRLVCRRETPEFPYNIPWSPTLEAKYADKRICNLTCPHRGISLANVTPDSDGHVTCPGHGLKWNLETGQLVKRTTLLIDPRWGPKK